MARTEITRDEFLADRQGRTFTDVVQDSHQPFGEVLAFFNSADRQRRMEESELHHDRAPLAGVVRELEAMPSLDQFLSDTAASHTLRFRQAVGVIVRMVMERRGWKKTGRKGSLGVRAAPSAELPAHNTGGLAFWFIRAERYERVRGMPFRDVRERCQEVESAAVAKRSATDRQAARRRTTRRRSARRAHPAA